MSVATEIHLAVQAGVQQLVYCYEHLTPQNLNSLKDCYTPRAQFKDPFNDVQGVERIVQVFEHMFISVDEPRFQVTEQVVHGQQAFLAWEFHFRMRRWRKAQPQCIRGGTFLRLDKQGKVLEHRDYWDTAEELYESFPMLGSLMRWLRKMGSAT